MVGRGAGAAPTRRAARILAGCFVARQSKTTAGILLPRVAHPAKIRSSAAIQNSDLVHQVVLRRSSIAMRIPARGSRIFAAWPLPTAMSDVAPTELGAFRG